VRIATKLIEHPTSYAFAQINDEVVLRHKEGAKSCITAKFLEDDRGIFVLSIQGYTIATGKPHNASFAFIGDEIGKLVEFINQIQSMPLQSGGGIRIGDDDLRRMVLSQQQAQAVFRDNEELFAEVIRSAITKEDVVAVGYRKRQLEEFDRLLGDESYFRQVMKKKDWTTEAVWQKFFEKNPWIFGHGLSYIQLSAFDNKKLEQVDALLRTRGVISSLCFVEIKTHKTALLNVQPYRAGCWAPSAELSGAVSQVQGTVALATERIRSKLALTDEVGNPTGEEAFNYLPKSCLVVGSL
jgi:hypothetical protein